MSENRNISNKFHTFLSSLKRRANGHLLIMIVFCFPVLLYMQTLWFGLTYADDNDIIINNLQFLSNIRNASHAFLMDAFLEKSSPLYRPLQTLSYMIDLYIAGPDKTWMFHLSNVLLLGLIGCLLFLMLRKFRVPAKAALAGTLIYSVHPLFVSSIAWIPARGDLLLSLFSLASFLFFIEFLQRRMLKHLLLHWICFTIALYCKETAALLPFLYILYFLAFSPVKRIEKKHLLLVLLYGVSGISWFWLRSVAIGSQEGRSDVGLIPFLANLRTIPESLATFLLPFDIALIPMFSSFKTWTGLAIILATIVFFVKLKERSYKEKLFGWVWFLLLLSPTLFYKTAYIDYLNHRFFLPLMGILLCALHWIPRKFLENRKSLWLALAIVLTLSVVTFIKARSYSSPLAFWNTSIMQNSNNALMYNNRGNVNEHNRDFQEAICDYTKAIDLDPRFAMAYYNRGNAYGAAGNLVEAIRDYDRTIVLKPNDANVYYNRGNVYGAKGDLIAAICDYSEAITLNNRFSDAFNNRGNAYYNLGSTDLAMKDFDKAIALDPFYAAAYNNRGMVYRDKGNLQMAIEDFDSAIGTAPNFAEAYVNRANAFAFMGLNEMAVRDYEMAIALDPVNAEVYTNCGMTYYALGNMNKAVNYLDRAIDLNPLFANAYVIRGAARYAMGDTDAAILDYNSAITLDSGFANAYYNRAMAYKAKGMCSAASQDFKKFEKIKNSQ